MYCAFIVLRNPLSQPWFEIKECIYSFPPLWSRAWSLMFLNWYRRPRSTPFWRFLLWYASHFTNTHTHTHRCLPVTHTGVTPLSTGADANCVCLVCVCVSISSLETHFSSELVTLCQKSANKVFCSDLSRNAAAPAFIFVWWELRKEKRSPPTQSCTITVLHANDWLLLCWL